MHLPDEFINSGAAASLAGAAAAMVGFAVHKVRQAFMEKIPVLKMRLATFPDFGGESGMSLESRLSRYGREQVWRMAVAGALIFAAQMVNFPVADGTSIRICNHQPLALRRPGGLAASGCSICSF